jgi:hypothetical protein
MSKRETILEELTKLAIAYPAAKRSMAEIEILADMWGEDLEDFSEREICQAVREHRKHSAFFPTSAEIRGHCEQIIRMRLPEQSQLPEQPTQLSEAERARYKEQAGRIIRMLSREKAMGEG